MTQSLIRNMFSSRENVNHCTHIGNMIQHGVKLVVRKDACTMESPKGAEIHDGVEVKGNVGFLVLPRQPVEIRYTEILSLEMESCQLS